MTAPPWWAVLAAAVFIGTLVAAQIVSAIAADQLQDQIRDLRGRVTRLEHPAARAHVREYRWPVVTMTGCAHEAALLAQAHHGPPGR